MIEPSEFARCFLETFDKSAVTLFRRWMATKPTTTKWIIAADFALRDKNRPGDCFAFTIIPYDAYPNDFADEVRRNLPKDLKASKTIDADGIAWLRDPRHFHILVPMKQDRVFYGNGPGVKSIDVVRQSIDMTLSKFVEMDRGKDQIARFRATRQKAKANNFNVALFTDLTLLAMYLALITLILCRERKPDLVSWFCDRDSMISFCDGIIWDYGNENFLGLAELLRIDRTGVTPIVAIPDRSSGKEDMWFDQYIRAPDWLAGALAAWNRDTNLLPGEHDKYVKLIEDVVSDSENMVILPVYLTEMSLGITRLEISRRSMADPPSPGVVVP